MLRSCHPATSHGAPNRPGHSYVSIFHLIHKLTSSAVWSLALFAYPTVIARTSHTPPAKPWYLPSDVVDLIVAQFRHDKACLKRCSLVSHQFSRSSQRYLFSKVRLETSSHFARFLELLKISPHIRNYVLSLEVTITFLKESDKADWMTINASIVADIFTRMKDQVTCFLMNFEALPLPFAAWPEDLGSAMWELLSSERLTDVRITYVSGFPLEWLADCGQLKKLYIEGVVSLPGPGAVQQQQQQLTKRDEETMREAGPRYHKPKGKLQTLHLFPFGGATACQFALTVTSPSSLLDLSALRVLFLSGSVSPTCARRLAHAAGPSLESFAYRYEMSTGLLHDRTRRLLSPFMQYVYTIDDVSSVAVGTAPIDLDWNTGIRRLEVSTDAGAIPARDYVAWLVPASNGVQKPLVLEECVVRVDMFSPRYSVGYAGPVMAVVVEDFYLWAGLDATLSRAEVAPNIKFVEVHLMGSWSGMGWDGGALKRRGQW